MPIVNNSLLTTPKRCLLYIIYTYIFTNSYIILSYIFTCILRTGIFQKLFFRLLCQCDFQSPITDQHHIRTVSNMYGGDFFVEIVHWFYCKLFSQKSSIKDVWKGPIIGSTQNLLSQMISIPNIIKHKHTKRSLIQMTTVFRKSNCMIYKNICYLLSEKLFYSGSGSGSGSARLVFKTYIQLFEPFTINQKICLI